MNGMKTDAGQHSSVFANIAKYGEVFPRTAVINQ